MKTSLVYGTASDGRTLSSECAQIPSAQRQFNGPSGHKAELCKPESVLAVKPERHFETPGTLLKVPRSLRAPESAIHARLIYSAEMPS